MKFISNLIGLSAIAAIATGVSYLYYPRAYASVATHTGDVLPITSRILRAVPALELDMKLNELKNSSAKLSINRSKLNKKRNEIISRITQYQALKQQSQNLLEEARLEIKRSPNRAQYWYRGASYDARELNVQIDSIQQQSDALVDSIEKLERAQQDLEKIFATVAARESSLVADISRIESAKLIVNNKEVLESLILNINQAAYEKTRNRVVYALRTVDELLQEHSSVGVRMFTNESTRDK